MFNRFHALFFFAGLSLITIGGCAIGIRKSDGAIVTGFVTDHAPEGVGAAITAAGEILPPPWGWVATLVGGVITGATTAHYRAKREGERSGWDEAKQEIGAKPTPASPVLSQSNHAPESSK